jgi:hypothetical protein
VFDKVTILEWLCIRHHGASASEVSRSGFCGTQATSSIGEL